MSTGTYQCQECGEVTSDGKCGCVGITTAKIILSCQGCESLKANNAALREVLEAVREALDFSKELYNLDKPTDFAESMAKSHAIGRAVGLIEQTLSKGKTE